MVIIGSDYSLHQFSIANWPESKTDLASLISDNFDPIFWHRFCSQHSSGDYGFVRYRTHADNRKHASSVTIKARSRGVNSSPCSSRQALRQRWHATGDTPFFLVGDCMGSSELWEAVAYLGFREGAIPFPSLPPPSFLFVFYTFLHPLKQGPEI